MYIPVLDLITAVITSLILALGHYFNWRGLIGSPLPRLAAYTYGTCAIVVPVSAGAALRGADISMLGLWLPVVCGGATVLLCRGIDSWIENRLGRIEAEERERQSLAVSGYEHNAIGTE